MQVAGVNQVGVLLAQSEGHVDPTASVQTRCVFAPRRHLDIYRLLQRDDGWRVDARLGGAHCARDGYTERSPNAVGLITGVDLAVTTVWCANRRAVSAMTLLPPRATITAADDPAVAMPVGAGDPDIVHVVPTQQLSGTGQRSARCRPRIPKAGRQAWYFNSGGSEYRRTRRSPKLTGIGAAMPDEALLAILVCPADRGPLDLEVRDWRHPGGSANPRLRRLPSRTSVLLVDEARGSTGTSTPASGEMGSSSPVVALQVGRGFARVSGRQRANGSIPTM